jgi:glycosyltransferase involved in cell wall biosynthesis
MVRICLITPHHVSFQPRILREADTLADAGHDVRVVARRSVAAHHEADMQLMATRRWRLQSVDVSSRDMRWYLRGIAQHAYSRLFALGIHSTTTSVGGYLKGMHALGVLAAAEQADWYIAHTQVALPAAHGASVRWGARLGFDCEDLLAHHEAEPGEVIRFLERRYLGDCDYISAPSAHIAAALTEEYGVRPPIVLYNVFPLRLADGLPAPGQRRPSSILRLHWFGQTIGPDRGLQDAFHALADLADAELHLRGRLPSAYASEITAMCRRLGIVDRVYFHDTVHHEDLIGSLSIYDVGLALERPDRKHYALTVTNKLFSYMLAGLAIAATDTPGQREVQGGAPDAGFLYPAGNPAALAAGIRGWMEQRAALLRAQEAAWQAARTRFCWDIECIKLFTALGLQASREPTH